MPYKFSKCICMEHPRHKEMVEFYRDVLGLEVMEDKGRSTELKAGPNRLFLDSRDTPMLVLELIVPDAEQAKAELLEHGCRIVRWEGKDECCYIRDPFGFLFNIYEDADAFSE